MTDLDGFLFARYSICYKPIILLFKAKRWLFIGHIEGMLANKGAVFFNPEYPFRAFFGDGLEFS